MSAHTHACIARAARRGRGDYRSSKKGWLTGGETAEPSPKKQFFGGWMPSLCSEGGGSGGGADDVGDNISTIVEVAVVGCGSSSGGGSGGGRGGGGKVTLFTSVRVSLVLVHRRWQEHLTTASAGNFSLRGTLTLLGRARSQLLRSLPQYPTFLSVNQNAGCVCLRSAWYRRDACTLHAWPQREIHTLALARRFQRQP